MKMRQIKFSARPRGGFTLVEVVVGIALVAIVVGALYTGMTFSAQRTSRTRENLRATQILLEKVEQVRLYRWEQILSAADLDDLDDPLFDPDDPHTNEDQPAAFAIPAEFTAPYTPGATNTGDMIYNGTFTVQPAPVAQAYSNNLLLVTVTLNWLSGSTTNNRSVQTLFAKNGLQNNISR